MRWNLRVVGIQNAIREANELNLVHAGTGKTLEEAVAPGYLHTPKGTVALIGMASGEVAPGGAATPTRPGVNELRVDRGVMGTWLTRQGIEAGIRRNDSQGIRLSETTRMRNAFSRVFGMPISKPSSSSCTNTITSTTSLSGRSFRKSFRSGWCLPPWIKKWTHEEVDAGADIVVMHGAPLVQGVEIYHNRPIFYDLGNFIFNLPPTITGLTSRSSGKV